MKNSMPGIALIKADIFEKRLNDIWNGIKQIGNDIYEWGSSVDWLGAVDEGLKSAIEGAIAGGCSSGFHGAIIGTISGFVAGFIYYVFDTQQVNKENEGD